MKSIKTIITLSGLAVALAVPAFAQETTDTTVTGQAFGPREDRGGVLLQRLTDRVDLPEDILVDISDYRESQASLRTELKNQIDALEDPTAEQIREITRQFQAENAAVIELQRMLADEIRTAVEEYRMENAPERPAGREAVIQARQQFREQRQGMVQARRQLRQELAAADSEEERAQLMNQFRQQQREMVQEVKETRRQLREQLRDGSGGDRRGGTGG